MVILGVFLCGFGIGLGFGSTVALRQYYTLRQEIIRLEYEIAQAETSAKYAELRGQIKVGGIGNVQEDATGSRANSQVQVGGTGNRQSIN